MLLATYVRESPDIKLGISLKRENGSLIVSNVPEWGVVAMQTDIRVGHRLLQINNMNCADMSAEEAVLILRDAIGTVILAVDDDIPNNNNNKDMLHTIPLAAAVPVSTPTPMVTATRTAQQHPGTGNAPLGREEGGIW